MTSSSSTVGAVATAAGNRRQSKPPRPASNGPSDCSANAVVGPVHLRWCRSISSSLAFLATGSCSTCRELPVKSHVASVSSFYFNISIEKQI